MGGILVEIGHFDAAHDDGEMDILKTNRAVRTVVVGIAFGHDDQLAVVLHGTIEVVGEPEKAVHVNLVDDELIGIDIAIGCHAVAGGFAHGHIDKRTKVEEHLLGVLAAIKDLGTARGLLGGGIYVCAALIFFEEVAQGTLFRLVVDVTEVAVCEGGQVVLGNGLVHDDDLGGHLGDGDELFVRNVILEFRDHVQVAVAVVGLQFHIDNAVEDQLVERDVGIVFRLGRLREDEGCGGQQGDGQEEFLHFLLFPLWFSTSTCNMIFLDTASRNKSKTILLVLLGASREPDDLLRGKDLAELAERHVRIQSDRGAVLAVYLDLFHGG